jgi:hypothetical protein
MKTSYSYGFDFSVTRELKGGFTFEAAYVGRLGRRLLQEKDLAQPLNLFDPKSGIGYFQAVTALAKIYRQGVTTNNFILLAFPPTYSSIGPTCFNLCRRAEPISWELDWVRRKPAAGILVG